jgi:hypothetical protein
MSHKDAGQGVHQFDHEGFIVAMMNPFITFITAAEPIDVGASMAELGQTLPVVGCTDAVRRSARRGPVRQPV